ncbi:MAG: DUF3105 domain-containing protein [Acidimicrobiia bacterium]
MPSHPAGSPPPRRPSATGPTVAAGRARRGATGLLAVLATSGSLLAACGGDDGSATGGCGRIAREALDPNHLVHVLGNATGVQYTSDPPTSGPHQPSPGIHGALDEPLSRPLQVGVLEEGGIVIQYRDDLAPGDVAELRALAADDVVVAPAPDLDDAVAATAWTYKRTCGSVDAAALREFVDQRRGHGPDQL